MNRTGDLPYAACRGHTASRRPHPQSALVRWGRRSIIALVLWSAGLGWASAQQVVGPPNAILCNLAAPLTGGGSAAKLISGIASTHINICGFTVTASAADTFAITTGTRTNCATNNAAVTGSLNVNTTNLVDHNPYAVLSLPTGADLCVNSTVTTSTGIIWYSQF